MTLSLAVGVLPLLFSCEVTCGKTSFGEVKKRCYRFKSRLMVRFLDSVQLNLSIVCCFFQLIDV